MPVVLSRFKQNDITDQVLNVAKKVSIWANVITSEDRIWELPLELWAVKIRNSLLHLRTHSCKRFITACTLYVFTLGLADTAIT